MDPVDIIEISRTAVFILIEIAAPVMLVALGVGLIIALFQALTQMQEMTLAFVPKILCIFLSIVFLLPYMLNTLVTFTQVLFQQMAQLGS